MAIDLGDIPTGTPPTAGEKLQIRSAIGVGQTDAPTFLAQTLTSQGLANAPSLAIGTGAGFYQPTNTQISFSGNNTEAIRFTGGGIRLGANELGWGTFAINTLILARDADGILAQRNGVNAQEFRIYNSYASAGVDFSRLRIGPVDGAGRFYILAENGGTGTVRGINIRAGAAKEVVFGVGTIDILSLNATSLSFLTDNTYDIGASGANRPRNVYVAGQVNVQGQSFFNGVNLSAGGGSVRLQSAAYGVMTVLDSDGTGNFNRMQLGGTTSAFPAIKRNGTGIHIVLADDSSFAPITCGSLVANSHLRTTDTSQIGWLNTRSSMISPSDGVIRLTNNAGTSYTRLELGEADMGIMRGTGTPENIVTAKVGSIYLRTDGTSGSSFYVKESSPTPTTGWVAK